MSASTDVPSTNFPVSGASPNVEVMEDNLHTAYMNCGRLSGGLARLHSTSSSFKLIAARNDKIATGSAESIARVLIAAHEDVKEHLLSVRNKFEEECDQLRNRLDQELDHAHSTMKARIGKEMMFANAAIGRKLEWSVMTVNATLQEASSTTRDELQDAMDSLSECGSGLQRDINETESRYMRSLAHIVMGNAWSSAL
ncbi:unnamed protein product [Tilletia controversa]|nr:hypothetical protein CF328_g5176 [Tilletia controversa]CAD6984167.1 unnamed protein product [Tilletia controversa]